jgi:hypothetical protein
MHARIDYAHTHNFGPEGGLFDKNFRKSELSGGLHTYIQFINFFFFFRPLAALAPVARRQRLQPTGCRKNRINLRVLPANPTLTRVCASRVGYDLYENRSATITFRL